MTKWKRYPGDRSYRKDHPMFKHVIECPETGDDRDDCECEKCAEYRATLEELRRDHEEEDWNRREQSRRIDAEYVNRRMPGGYAI